MKLERNIIKVGNSAGVLLPRSWLHGKAEVILLEKPSDIRHEILEILSPFLEEIIGIYLVGSYARGEETEISDIDVLVVTHQINKTIKKGKYSLLLISKDTLEKALSRNILPLFPMLHEAKTLLNKEFLSKYRKITLTKRNMAFYLEITKSSMNICKGFIELSEEDNSNLGDGIAHSLILGLRSAYIVDHLIKNKSWNTADLLALIEKISGSLEAYEGYIRAKHNKKYREKLPGVEAKRIYAYIIKKLEKHGKWIRKKDSKK